MVRFIPQSYGQIRKTKRVKEALERCKSQKNKINSNQKHGGEKLCF